MINSYYLMVVLIFVIGRIVQSYSFAIYRKYNIAQTGLTIEILFLHLRLIVIKGEIKIGFRMNSTEVARTAIFSSILTIADVLSYQLVWPMLPPILVAPFVTCFILGISLPFSKHQWVIGLVASLVTVFFTGGILCGPFILPIYGFVFQTRWVKFSSAFSPVVHMFYGVFLAPFVFSVAPAKIVYNWLLLYLGNIATAIMVAVLIFAVGGMITGASGYRLGLRIAKNMKAN